MTVVAGLLRALRISSLEAISTPGAAMRNSGEEDTNDLVVAVASEGRTSKRDRAGLADATIESATRAICR